MYSEQMFEECEASSLHSILLSVGYIVYVAVFPSLFDTFVCRQSLDTSDAVCSSNIHLTRLHIISDKQLLQIVYFVFIQIIQLSTFNYKVHVLMSGNRASCTCDLLQPTHSANFESL